MSAFGLGKPPLLHPDQSALGTRCIARVQLLRTSRPPCRFRVFRCRLASRSFHRRSRRHPTLPCALPSLLSWPKPPLSRPACRLASPRPSSWVWQVRHCSFRLLPLACKHSFLQLLPAIMSALNGCFASPVFQTIRLALGVSFVHFFSQDERGQQPPYLCFEKILVKSVPCGSSFPSFPVPKTS